MSAMASPKFLCAELPAVFVMSTTALCMCGVLSFICSTNMDRDAIGVCFHFKKLGAKMETGSTAARISMIEADVEVEPDLPCTICIALVPDPSLLFQICLYASCSGEFCCPSSSECRFSGSSLS